MFCNFEWSSWGLSSLIHCFPYNLFFPEIKLFLGWKGKSLKCTYSSFHGPIFNLLLSFRNFQLYLWSLASLQLYGLWSLPLVFLHVYYCPINACSFPYIQTLAITDQLFLLLLVFSWCLYHATKLSSYTPAFLLPAQKCSLLSETLTWHSLTETFVRDHRGPLPVKWISLTWTSSQRPSHTLLALHHWP